MGKSDQEEDPLIRCWRLNLDEDFEGWSEEINRTRVLSVRLPLHDEEG